MNKFNNYFIIFSVITLIILLFINVILYIFKKFENTITIKEKYVYSTRYSPQYVIVDSNNNIYNIKNVWFIADFNSAEEYNSVKIGQTYKVKGFGIRVNFLGWYPTIYELTDL